MTNFTPSETARPWWAEIAQEREQRERSAFSVTDDVPVRAALPTEAPAPRQRRHVATSRSRAHAPVSRPRSDWFAEEARTAGRPQSRPAAAAARKQPQRPRATLVDVAPLHATAPRAQQVRRAPGERPTVTITGRPDAALPPQPIERRLERGERARSQALALVASPDRLMLWAVVLGVLMIAASIGTAGAEAAVALR